MSAREGTDTKFSSIDLLDKESDIVNRLVTESVVARSGSEADFSRGEDFYVVDRPVTESVTTRPETDIDFFGEEESELVNRPITRSAIKQEGSCSDSPEEEDSLVVNRPGTELVTTRHGSDSDFLSSKHSDFADRLLMTSVSIRSGGSIDHDSNEHSRVLERPVRESVRERPTYTLETLGVHMPIVVAETLDLGIVGLCLTDKRNMPICRKMCISDSQLSRMTSPLAFQQIDTENDTSLGTNGCFGVCETVNGDRCPVHERRGAGPVHERRGAESEHKTLCGVQLLCSDIYIP